jgi:hypothetical protein
MVTGVPSTVPVPVFTAASTAGWIRSTAIVISLHTAVEVVESAVERVELEMVEQKSKLPLSVVALSAEGTCCSAGPFPRRGCWAGFGARSRLCRRTCGHRGDGNRHHDQDDGGGADDAHEGLAEVEWHVPEREPAHS